VINSGKWSPWQPSDAVDHRKELEAARCGENLIGTGRLAGVTSPTKDHLRATRLREFDLALARARQSVQVMGLIVRGRESRPQHADVGPDAAPHAAPEAVFAATKGDDRPALPAGIWVALRRDDTDAAMDALRAVSPKPFLVSEHEEMGPGFRLQLVEEKRELPDADRLRAQLAAVLDIPADVVAILEDWGADDPRTEAEIDTLLDNRFGPIGAPAPAKTEPAAPRRRSEALEMSVADTAAVLQLSEAQAKVLATLVRAAGVTIIA
jgi:hypothetical protein